MYSRLFVKTLFILVLACVALLVFRFPVFVRADEEPVPIVLYDSSKQTTLDSKGKNLEEKQQGTGGKAPSNVVFMDDEIDPTNSDEEDFSLSDEEDFSLNPDSPDDAESGPSNANEVQSADDVAPDSALTNVDTVDVLIDMRHAYDFSDYPLSVDDRYYHRVYSFHRAFESLRARGVRVEKYDSKEPITSETLARCKTLFINLPSGDKEPFLVSEIIAIHDFVESGGSLFLITDHTNCYFHQSRLTPLFHELDIKPQHYGVCDKEQSLGSSGFGWIYIDKFDEHPITRGLRHIAFQTGGGVDPRFAVAWSGPNSWQDAPIMPIYGEADLAYYGNFSLDSNESAGSSGVVLAKELKKGKIVVVADQNIFSPFFLHYLDVFRLWNNIFAWTLDRPDLADVSQYVQTVKQGRLLVCWEELMHDASRFGDPDPNGYYHIFTTLCRYYNIFCVAHNDPAITPDAIVLLHGGKTYSPEGLDYAYKQLLAGKPLIVIDPSDDVLDDESSELSILVKKLVNEAGVGFSVSSPIDNTSGKNYVERFELTNDGTITLVRCRNSYDNNSIPKPESRLLFTQMEDIKVLLNVIDAALKPKEVSGNQDKTSKVETETAEQ